MPGTDIEDDGVSDAELTKFELKEVRRVLSDRKFKKKFWTLTRTVAIYVGSVAGALTVGFALLKDVGKFIVK